MRKPEDEVREYAALYEKHQRAVMAELEFEKLQFAALVRRYGKRDVSDLVRAEAQTRALAEIRG